MLAKPLTMLLQKKMFQWSNEAHTAFEALKQAMSSTPVLVLPNFTEPFVLRQILMILELESC